MIDVFLNGIKQRSGVDFTATNGSVVTMTPFISNGDVVEFQKIDQLRVGGITSVTNATNAYNIVGGVSFATSAGIATALNSDSSINTSGIITATSFYGDGSDIADGKWTLGANGTSDYTFTGIGLTQTTNDPILYLARGRVYEFVNSMGAHPFEIRQSAGGSAYNSGVTNNAVSNGTLRFEIPFDAPNTLYYQCTSHAGMGSTIVVYPNTI